MRAVEMTKGAGVIRRCLSTLAILSVCTSGCGSGGNDKNSVVDSGSNDSAEVADTGAAPGSDVQSPTPLDDASEPPIQAEDTAGPSPEPEDTAVPPPEPEDTAVPPAELSGVEVYAAVCASCHGVEGEGTEFGYELKHPVVAYTNWVVRHGRDGQEFPGTTMPAFNEASVSDAQLAEIWAWLNAFPKPTDGEGLYVDFCSSCHGPDANGGFTGKDIQDKGDSPSKIMKKVRKGKGGSDYGNRKKYMPAWSADVLSDDDVYAIAEYLTSL